MRNQFKDFIFEKKNDTSLLYIYIHNIYTQQYTQYFLFEVFITYVQPQFVKKLFPVYQLEIS